LSCAFLVLVVFIKISFAQQASHDERGTIRIDLVDLSAPVYPPLARGARIMGDVEIKLSIRKDGSVASSEMISGHPMLIPSAIEAVSQWRYKPYYLNGQPVEVDTQVTVNFVLQGG
jgi:protein TonB